MFNNTNRWLRPDDWTTPLYRANCLKVSKVFLLYNVTYLSNTVVLFHSDVIVYFLLCSYLLNILSMPEYFALSSDTLIVVNHCCTRLSSSLNPFFPQFFSRPVKLFYLFTTENSFDRAQNCSDPICCLFIAFFFPSVISHENWHFNVKSFFLHVGK